MTVKLAKRQIADILQELHAQGVRIEAITVQWTSEAEIPAPGTKAAEELTSVEARSKCSIGFEARL